MRFSLVEISQIPHIQSNTEPSSEQEEQITIDREQPETTAVKSTKVFCSTIKSSNLQRTCSQGNNNILIMSGSELVPKKNMTDEERLALAAKLDNDLEDFIEGLERKRYEDGWPEDRWEEEMDKHPFFMKKPPEIDGELHPMLEGLQQLKYDPMENTNEDLAATYKTDGNFYMEHKKLRMSIFSYTEGIKLKCQNAELNSILYNNRSAAQFFLKNYRSSIEDANKAIALNPKYLKAIFRAAQCNSALKKYDECIAYCDQVLAIDPKHRAALDLRKETVKTKTNKERDERKQASIQKRKDGAELMTLQAIEARGIRFEEHLIDDPLKRVTPELIKPGLEPLEEHPVHLEEDGSLVWPATFLYPEFLFSDFHHNVSENALLNDVLAEMFAEPLEVDKKGRYRPGALAVYFENRLAGSVHKVNIFNRVADIITDKSFLVSGGCLTFCVLPKDTDTELEFVNKPRRPMRRY